jgi:signal transduction histidine kinase/HAMP domain-containing protein
MLKALRDSVAGRLTLWFLLLSFIPIAVLAIFVRRSVTETFVELGLRESERQAVILAEAVSSIEDLDKLAATLTKITDGVHSAILIDKHGFYAIPSNSLSTVHDEFSEEVVDEVLSGTDGSVLEADTGRLIGYSSIPARGLVVLVMTDGSVVSSPLYQIERGAFVQLAVSLIIVSIVGGLAIWIVIGPIRKLTSAAEAVGEGNLGVELDESEMEGELLVLTHAFNRMVRQLRESYGVLEHRVSARTRELTALNSIAAIMSSSLVLDEILDDALEKALEVLDFESGAIFILDSPDGDLRMAVHRGLSDKFREQVSKGLLSDQVARSAEPLFIDDLTQFESAPEAVLDEGYRTVASIPLLSKGKVEGVLTIARRTTHQFGASNLALINGIANQIGVAIESSRLYENEHRRAEQFRVIGEVGRQITSILDIDALLREITRLVAHAFGYYIVHIGLIEEGGLVFRGRAAGDRPHPYDFISPVRLELDSQGITTWVARHGEPLLVPDVSQDLRYLSVRGMPEIRAELALPVMGRGELIGVLDIESDRLNAFEEDDIAILQSLANQAGIAIQNAKLYEQARQFAVLEERQRLARELHDSVTQEIYGVTMFAEAAGRLLAQGNEAQAADHLNDLQESAQEALAEMRLLIYELRPPVLEQVGLAGALQARLEAVEGRSGLETSFTAEGQFDFEREVQENLYGIAREALNNSLKHAHASRLSVELVAIDSTVRLQISDDGIGFDPNGDRGDGGMGIRGMEERAEQIGAQLSIESKPGEGTSIVVEVTD